MTEQRHYTTEELLQAIGRELKATNRHLAAIRALLVLGTIAIVGLLALGFFGVIEIPVYPG